MITHRIRVLWAAAFITMAALTTPLHGQAPRAGVTDPPESGERVRIHLTDGRRVEGRLASLNADSVTVWSNSGIEASHAASRVAQIWVSRESSRATLPGLAIGAGAGFAGGLYFGGLVGLLSDLMSLSERYDGPSGDEVRSISRIGGASAGALLGAGIGYLIIRRQWTPVHGSDVRVSAAPVTGGGAGVQLSIRPAR
jgi:hypothetical protein